MNFTEEQIKQVVEFLKQADKDPKLLVLLTTSMLNAYVQQMENAFIGKMNVQVKARNKSDKEKTINASMTIVSWDEYDKNVLTLINRAADNLSSKFNCEREVILAAIQAGFAIQTIVD